MRLEATNLPYVAPITRHGMNSPLGMPAPYVQQANIKYMKNTIHRVGRVNAPIQYTIYRPHICHMSYLLPF